MEMSLGAIKLWKSSEKRQSEHTSWTRNHILSWWNASGDEYLQFGKKYDCGENVKARKTRSA